MNEKSTIVVTLDLFHLNYVKGFFSYDCARWFCTVMSECFVVFFQIFVAHLERNIRFWWFLRTFWSLGIRLVERYFCFLFSGRFFKFFGRISILCFCATISTYQQIISQNNRKKWQIAKKSLKGAIFVKSTEFITFLRSWSSTWINPRSSGLRQSRGPCFGDEVQ